MIYSIYDPITGQILFSTYHADDDPNAIEGEYTDINHYVNVETKTIVNKPAKPSLMHYWDHDSKQWQLDTTQAEIDVRNQRGWRLNDVDRVNPVWYNSLTVEQQTELALYRQALLDVPEQTGFPTDVVWPTKPTWL